MSLLYVVATPIGNLSDITFRAVETLKTVNFILAEDTRHAKILCDKYGIETKLLSFHAKSTVQNVNDIIRLLKVGETMALISDAGTPCVSDPGFRLVLRAAKEGIKVVPIPGPSALTAFVSVCGMPANDFCFHGFLPHKKGRQTLLKSFLESDISHIFYESVHRFPKCLKELLEFLGENRKICVGRELTKIYEDVFRGTVGEALKYFTKENIKGEFVVLVAPKKF